MSRYCVPESSTSFVCFVSGIPVIFVAIGLGAVHDEYGVKDESGDYK